MTGNNNNNNGGFQSGDETLTPYNIHPSENPTIMCVTPQLEAESNYHGWQKECSEFLPPRTNLKSVLYIEHMVAIWNDLKERYLQGDKVRVAALYQDILNFKQRELKVSDFFTEICDMWEELEQFKPMPQCTCHIARTCVVTREKDTIKQEEVDVDSLRTRYSHIMERMATPWMYAIGNMDILSVGEQEEEISLLTMLELSFKRSMLK
ncbi:hypothetical protein KIW84_051720 [Lathyrus oleraceus]|uniref:Retrotransposon gag domain-containing protein n=1 Tax=Pisum sativum TaxID=3888 RepID=A0A9D4WPV8_PEA|nr:hypothetical protein KIW84_051720 [Pisum sativum]